MKTLIVRLRLAVAPRRGLGLACALGAALTIAAAGCATERALPQDRFPEPPKDAIAKTTEVGPVKATVRVWPAKPALSDSIFAQLTVEAPAGVTLEVPYQDSGDQRLGRFRVITYTTDTVRKPDGGQIQTQSYRLEAPGSGRQRIPPLLLEMTDMRKDAPSDAQKPQEILTEEIPLEVAPIPVEAASTPLKPALGELDATIGGVSWLTVLGLLSALAVLGSGAVLGFRAMRARRRIEQQRTAYDDAVLQLQRLESKGPPDAQTADGWFVELSAIVRRYLEQRYEIRAPELTTEEFLQVATARPELSAEHRTLLTLFLERCDRVKFAGYRPDADESLATLKAARGFVEDTRLREPMAVAVAVRTTGSGKAA